MKIKIKVKNKADKNYETVLINTEYITLDAALKFTGVAGTGGQAKILVMEGLTKVNGEKNDIFRKKLYDGDTFEVEDMAFQIKREEKF
ncbi:MAG: RNA-binding S4 domain-containing protein [Oscillospiraceae bacterium]|nr:RNA-binding S4 domain-containing protein [Candidatus Limimonas coprohippi]MCQ2488384.1 RNA-binding S4 domain-containing protein [Clostridia bacterium]